MFSKFYKICSRLINDQNDEKTISMENLVESDRASSTGIETTPLVIGNDNAIHSSPTQSGDDDSMRFKESKLLHETILSQAKLWHFAGRSESESGNFDIALKYFEKAIFFVDQTEKFYRLGGIYCDIAMTYIRKVRKLMMECDQVDKDQLFDCLNHAEKYLPDELGGLPEYVEKFPQIFEELAQIYSKYGDNRKALINYVKRIKAVEFLDNNSELLLQAEIDLARCYDTLNNFKKCVEHYENAYTLAIRLDRTRIKSEISCELGYQFFMKQDFLSAKLHFQKFYVFSERIENYQDQAKASWYLSKIYLNSNELDNAEKFARIHLELARTIEDENEVEVAKRSLEDIQILKEKNHSQANLSMNEEYQRISGSGLFKSAELCLELGELFYTDNDYLTAKHFFGKLYAMTGISGDILQQAKAAWYLSKIYLEMKDYATAWQYAFEQVELAKVANNQFELDFAQTNMKIIKELLKKNRRN